jgi:hypothetical protein
MKSSTPNDFGKKFLVEECQKITMSEYLLLAKTKLKEALLASETNISDTLVSFKTSETRFGGTRHWFACPSCNRRVGVLFIHPLTQDIGCRICLGLEYRKRRFKGMIENYVK